MDRLLLIERRSKRGVRTGGSERMSERVNERSKATKLVLCVLVLPCKSPPLFDVPGCRVCRVSRVERNGQRATPLEKVESIPKRVTISYVVCRFHPPHIPAFCVVCELSFSSFSCCLTDLEYTYTAPQTHTNNATNNDQNDQERGIKTHKHTPLV